MVRQANRVRLDGNYGARPGNLDYRRAREIIQMRPGVRIARAEAIAITPPPPAVPAPAPPPGPPPVQFYPTDDQRGILHTDRRLTSNSRPILRPVAEIAHNQPRDPIIARTGAARPRLPQLGNMSPSSGTPPRPLRTTPGGTRLEIAPDSMASRSTPGESRPDDVPPTGAKIATTTSGPNRPTEAPELDSEA